MTVSHQAKELGGGFPFQIQDKEGTDTITLTKRDQKEQIEVEVFLPSPADPVDQNDEQEGRPEDDNCQSQYFIPLMVKIYRGLVLLEINCCSYPDELVIESLAFGSSDESVLSSVEAKLR
jgi:complement component 1 Q subcomponent-binding protein, mitochondrial